jgi:hypothetical protein
VSFEGNWGIEVIKRESWFWGKFLHCLSRIVALYDKFNGEIWPNPAIPT